MSSPHNIQIKKYIGFVASIDLHLRAAQRAQRTSFERGNSAPRARWEAVMSKSVDVIHTCRCI
jgi:hypothetical protein